MTKTISIYAAQILLGVIAIAAGTAKLSGAGVMVHHFHAIGLGPGFLLAAGTCDRRQSLPRCERPRSPPPACTPSSPAGTTAAISRSSAPAPSGTSDQVPPAATP